MSCESLIIFVEGHSDLRFFEAVIEPKLKGIYKYVETMEYARMKEEKIDNRSFRYFVEKFVE